MKKRKKTVTKKVILLDDWADRPTNLYKAIADKAGLSELTIRTAFNRNRGITYKTALRIAKAIGGVDINAFRIIEDGRGRKK